MSENKSVKSGTAPSLSIGFPVNQRDYFIKASNEMAANVAKVLGESKPNKSLLWQTMVSQGAIVANMDKFEPKDGVTYLVVPLG